MEKRGLGLMFAAMLGSLVWQSASGVSVGQPEPETSRNSREHLCQLKLGNHLIRFEPSTESGLRQLQAWVDKELRRQSGNPARTEERLVRGLKELERLLKEALAAPDQHRRETAVALVLETVMAIDNTQRSPVPERVDGVAAPLELAAKLYSPVGRGSKPATNLGPGEGDLSRRDPVASTFWVRPRDIAGEDLYAGFGRGRPLQIGDQICTYERPKESFGMNPGFEVRCGGTRVKLKFAELHSEPFAARVFAALGYHADPTDFVPQVKVRYDRRIFLEFNSREALNTEFTVLGFVPVYTLKLQRRYDPFDYVAIAKLRDGQRWTGAELKQRLLLHPEVPGSDTQGENFRPDVEGEIDYLVMKAANVQPRQPGVKSIGPWDFGQLDHAERRELRGAGLLAAWLGWFDTRYDNTRLRTVKRDGKTELAHYFSDLGGVLGQTSGWLFSQGERPNDFPWTVTRPPLWQGPGRMARPLRFEGYKPIALTPAFAGMTLDDARWMARLLGQLTERQLTEALVASGYDSAEVRLYTEKLVSRRDAMIVDLGLANEIKLLRPAGVDRSVSYDPGRAGPVVVHPAGSGEVRAPTGDTRLAAGVLVRGEALPTVRNGHVPRAALIPPRRKGARGLAQLHNLPQ